jgi:nitrite reductase (NADH) small subunit/3-phenylpropionate/trans-cinnamate dioxygenase ferredoxin subunit
LQKNHRFQQAVNNMSEFTTVAKVGDIPVNEGRAFEVDERMVAVFNREGEYFAIDDMCPHMGASLATGHFDAGDCTVTCPWHAWRFDTRDGTWCDNRRLKIDVFQVRVVGDEIQVGPIIVEAQ